MKNIIPIKAVAFDLDGTIYFGEQLAEGARELIAYLDAQNIQHFFFTNNSFKSRQEVFEKLLRLGLQPELARVYTTTYVSGIYAARFGVHQPYCVGTAGLTGELARLGIMATEDVEAADALIIGLDPGFTYDKIARAMRVIQRGKAVFACNRDASYPVENQRRMPGCGAMVAAIETASGHKVEHVIGKPNTYMMEQLCQDWGLDAAGLMVVGDTYTSDILMARNFNCRSVLIGPGQGIFDVPVAAGLAELQTLLARSIEYKKGMPPL